MTGQHNRMVQQGSADTMCWSSRQHNAEGRVQHMTGSSSHVSIKGRRQRKAWLSYDLAQEMVSNVLSPAQASFVLMCCYTKVKTTIWKQGNYRWLPTPNSCTVRWVCACMCGAQRRQNAVWLECLLLRLLQSTQYMQTLHLGQLN